MTGEKQPSRALNNLERTLFGAGAVLLVSFFLVKGWSANESQAGISAFEEARAVSLDLPGDGKVSDVPVDRQPTNGATPDYTLWSEHRIRGYEESIRIASNAPQAVLTIDHLDIRVPVYNGASEFNLNRGVARIKGTGRVGEVGNIGIAGHRDGFFRPLKDVQVGDRFQLETFKGKQDYVVSSIDIIDPSQVDVLAPTDAPTVTLVTCYPFYFVGHAPKRFIVKGEVITHQVNS